MSDHRPTGAGSSAAPPIDPRRHNVVVFPGSSNRADPFGQLTARFIIAQHWAGLRP